MLRQLEPGGQEIRCARGGYRGTGPGGPQGSCGNDPGGACRGYIVELIRPNTKSCIMRLRDYPQFLALEYPRYAWGAAFRSWLPARVSPSSNGHYGRAVAKAVYGAAYYSGMRPMHRALRAFSDRVEASRTQVVIAVVFGLGGGTGSGIAVDFGAPSVEQPAWSPGSRDRDRHRTLQRRPARARRRCGLFPVLNELDCLGDETRKRVVASCGELFRNPFTAGFILVPQSQVSGRMAPEISGHPSAREPGDRGPADARGGHQSLTDAAAA